MSNPKGDKMKKLSIVNGILFMLILLPAAARAETTVTVDQGNVTVDQNQPNTVTTTVVRPAATQTVVVQNPPVVFTKTEDPREIEGVIVRVEIPRNEIVVEDVNGREHRVLMKQGMINNNKVDDYVKIYLMADMREAKTIQTQRTADLDGNIVTLDYTNSVVVIHENDRDSRVLMTPAMISRYKVGDHVRLYVVTNYNDLQEAKIIRVR